MLWGVTLDDLIAAAEELRSKLGGATTVLLMTPRGYAHPALVDGIGFVTRDGQGEPVVIVGPGAAASVRPT